MNPEKVEMLIQEGLTHLRFCAELYEMQLREGRFFLHEHPLFAKSWHVPEIVKIAIRKMSKQYGAICAVTAWWQQMNSEPPQCSNRPDGCQIHRAY